MTCNKCNAEYVGGGFCGYCGNPMTGASGGAPTAQPYQTPQPQTLNSQAYSTQTYQTPQTSTQPYQTQPYQTQQPNAQPYPAQQYQQQYPPQSQHGAWNAGGAVAQTAKRPINKAVIIGIAAAAVVIIVVLIVVLGGGGIPDGEYYLVSGPGATSIGSNFSIRGDKFIDGITASYGYSVEFPYKIEGNRFTIGVGLMSMSYDFEMRGGSVFLNGSEYRRR